MPHYNKQFSSFAVDFAGFSETLGYMTGAILQRSNLTSYQPVNDEYIHGNHSTKTHLRELYHDQQMGIIGDYRNACGHGDDANLIFERIKVKTPVEKWGFFF